MPITRWPVEKADDVIVWGGGNASNPGVVVAMGSKYIHVAVYGRVVKFLHDTRQRADGRPGYMETIAQAANRDARDTARHQLREHGINVETYRSDVHWTTDQLQQLAGFVLRLQTGSSPS